jgi:hypothetical protein
MQGYKDDVMKPITSKVMTALSRLGNPRGDRKLYPSKPLVMSWNPCSGCGK